VINRIYNWFHLPFPEKLKFSKIPLTVQKYRSGRTDALATNLKNRRNFPWIQLPRDRSSIIHNNRYPLNSSQTCSESEDFVDLCRQQLGGKREKADAKQLFLILFSHWVVRTLIFVLCPEKHFLSLLSPS